MGGAIATRIIHAGWRTILWARRSGALDEFRGPNVEVAETPAELAATADVIGICVWSDDDVREVVAGERGVIAGCRPGTVIAVHSTVLPSTVRELAALAAKTGVRVVDAPVSGGRRVALAGFLTLAVGGDAGALAYCRPVFDAFAGEVVCLGDVGAGQVAKLLNNMLFAANLAVADDAITLGEAMGVDAGALAQFLAAGSGAQLRPRHRADDSSVRGHEASGAARVAEGRRPAHHRGRGPRHREYAAPQRGGRGAASPAGSAAGLAMSRRRARVCPMPSACDRIGTRSPLTSYALVLGRDLHERRQHRLPDLRRRQPHVRDGRRVHEVPSAASTRD